MYNWLCTLMLRDYLKRCELVLMRFWLTAVLDAFLAQSCILFIPWHLFLNMKLKTSPATIPGANSHQLPFWYDPRPQLIRVFFKFMIFLP